MTEDVSCDVIIPIYNQMNKLKIHLLFLLLIALGCQKDAPFDKKIEPSDFLSDDDYDKLIVEIQYISGQQPSSTTLDNLKSFLQNRLHKSSITTVQTSIGSPNHSSYTLTDIKNIEEDNRTQVTKGKTLTAYFLFLDADYASNNGNSKVLGVAYGNTSMAIFEKTIKEYSGGIGEPSTSTVETAVINHEFGHILGLVNNGTPMNTNHQDNANGKHCNVQSCLMYFNVETSDIIANLLGGGVPQLDTHCIKDLQDNGGK